MPQERSELRYMREERKEMGKEWRERGEKGMEGKERGGKVDMNMQLLYLPCFSLYIHDIHQSQHFTTTIAN